MDIITRWMKECAGPGFTFSYKPVYINGVLKRYEVEARIPVEK